MTEALVEDTRHETGGPHVVDEATTARHCGHADLMREAVDGRTHI